MDEDDLFPDSMLFLMDLIFFLLTLSMIREHIIFHYSILIKPYLALF